MCRSNRSRAWQRSRPARRRGEGAAMSTVDEGQTRSRYNRRGFLKRAGAGAGAVAVSGGVGAAIAPRAVAARSATVSTNPTTFGRIFPNLPPFAAATDAVRAALADLGKPGGLLDANDDLSTGPVLLITDLSLSANNPEQPGAHRWDDVRRPVRRPRHHLRYVLALGSDDGSGRIAELADAVARPRLGVWGGPGREPAP